MDSRDYIVAFELGSTGDCPPDFELPPNMAGFDAGLFLPRDDPDWFGRSFYPPRILLLKDGALHIASHPSTGEAPRQFPMERIASVESGHMLLKGWLRFTGCGFDCTVPYNTRGFPAVFRFLRRFRDRWLGGIRPAETAAADAGTGLDIKFGNALARELDSGEAVLKQAYEPPREVGSKTWLIPHRHWLAGDLLALTARRLLWITDREKGAYAPFGSIASYAPLAAVRSVGLTPGRRGQVLQVELNGGCAWQVPVARDSGIVWHRTAGDFATALAIQKKRNEASGAEARG
ncbi:MAG: hypothetical protein ABSH56_34640 [Bryobacteraceae bacterium]|jgi:hypothetical protein